MGYQSCFPPKIVFEPKCFGGIEAKDLECEQGAAKIQALLKHIRNDSTVGQAARILLRWAQIQAGTSKPILEATQNIPYIENNYILTLRHYMQQIQATLKEEEPWTVPKSWINDKHIMDELLASPLIPSTDYNEMNYCRMYLQVTRLADISTSDGKRIRSDMQEGDRNVLNRDQTIDWPYQQKPGKASWKKWKKNLRLVFCHQADALTDTLGQWTLDKEIIWNNRYSKDHNILYTKRNGEWYAHAIKHTNKIWYIIATSNEGEQTVLPLNTVPITDLEERYDKQRFTVPASLATQKRTASNKPTKDFEDYNTTLPLWVQQLISGAQEYPHDNELELHELLKLQWPLNLVIQMVELPKGTGILAG
jgi:hypothetical protein